MLACIHTGTRGRSARAQLFPQVRPARGLLAACSASGRRRGGEDDLSHTPAGGTQLQTGGDYS